MIKVKRIKEKLDLKVNDSNSCKKEWEASKTWNNPFGDVCLTDCCSDCSTQSNHAYKSDHY